MVYVFLKLNIQKFHNNDVIMDSMASQITSLTIIYSTVYSDADQRKHQISASLAFCAGNSPGTGEFPAQMASNAENVSNWWRHHACLFCHCCCSGVNILIVSAEGIGLYDTVISQILKRQRFPVHLLMDYLETTIHWFSNVSFVSDII